MLCVLLFQAACKDMKLREFRQEDADVICKWIKDETSLYEWSADRISRYPFTAGDLVDHHKRTMSEEKFMPFTYVDNNGVPIGHMAIRYPDEHDKSCVRFGFVIIAPVLRRRGLAAAMLEEACEYSRDVLHASKASLSVFTTNEKAIRCYESRGFRRTGETESYELPAGSWEGVVMERDL